MDITSDFLNRLVFIYYKYRHTLQNWINHILPTRPGESEISRKSLSNRIRFASCTNSSRLKATFTSQHDVLMLHFTKQFRKGRIFESTRSPIVTFKWSFSTIAAGKALFPCIGVLPFRLHHCHRQRDRYRKDRATHAASRLFCMLKSAVRAATVTFLVTTVRVNSPYLIHNYPFRRR